MSCPQDGSGILFGFFRPKRYSGQRVKTPKILFLKSYAFLIVELKLVAIILP